MGSVVENDVVAVLVYEVVWTGLFDWESEGVYLWYEYDGQFTSVVYTVWVEDYSEGAGTDCVTIN